MQPATSETDVRTAPNAISAVLPADGIAGRLLGSHFGDVADHQGHVLAFVVVHDEELATAGGSVVHGVDDVGHCALHGRGLQGVAAPNLDRHPLTSWANRGQRPMESST